MTPKTTLNAASCERGRVAVSVSRSTEILETMTILWGRECISLFLAINQICMTQ